MKFILLVKREGDRLEEVKVFDTYVSHYVEWDSGHSTTLSHFTLPKEECIKMYLQAGFEEAKP